MSTGRAIGCSTKQGLALLSLKDGTVFAAGSESVNGILMSWLGEWRSLESPGFERMEPAAEQGRYGWFVRAKLRLNEPGRGTVDSNQANLGKSSSR